MSSEGESKQVTTTWKLPSAIEDIINHGAFVIEGFDRILDAIKKQELVTKVAVLVDEKIQLARAQTELTKLQVASLKNELQHNKEVIDKVQEHQEILVSMDKRLQDIVNRSRHSWRDSKNTKMGPEPMVVVRRQRRDEREGDVTTRLESSTQSPTDVQVK